MPMAFNNLFRTAPTVVPLLIRASTGRQWYLHQHCRSAAFAAANGPRNLLHKSSPSTFLHHYSTNSRVTTPNHPLRGSKAKMEEFENELSNIVGLHELKLQLQKWAKGMLLDKQRGRLGLKVGDRRPPHMAFLGNPGTGKTSVARILGKLLHLLGILPTDKVTEVQRTDLVGQYIGETGTKTRKKIQKAKGGILFVDEAYRLIPSAKSDDQDYGKDALEEIMSVMDSGKVVVIFAGYNEPMQRVISSNEGFSRRVTKFFQFDDFSCEDLAKILHLKMSNPAPNSPLHGFKLHPSCTVKAVAAMIKRETTEKQRNVMNGGLVDAMLVNAKENLDSRTDLKCIDTDSLLTITLDDLEVGLRLLTKLSGKKKKQQIK